MLFGLGKGPLKRVSLYDIPILQVCIRSKYSSKIWKNKKRIVKQYNSKEHVAELVCSLLEEGRCGPERRGQNEDTCMAVRVFTLSPFI